MLIPSFKNKFKKDLKLAKKQKKKIKLFEEILVLLLNKKPLPAKYKNHLLIGNYKNCWECHIEPDWLLVYEKTGTHIICHRLSSHSDLFK